MKETTIFTEDSWANKHDNWDPYTTQKIMAEEWFWEFYNLSENKSMDFVSIIPTNVLGAYMSINFRGFCEVLYEYMGGQTKFIP